MNKTLIALALAAVAGGASAATDFSPAVNGGDNTNAIYSADGANLFLGGRAEFRGDFNGNEDGSDIDGTMADKSRVRLNVGGTTQITDTLSGFGFYEAEQTTKSANDDSKFQQRYAYVGLMGTYGAVSFGRQNTAGVQISDMSDIATYTGDQKAFIYAGNEQINNTIAYTGQFDALTVKASVIAGEEDDSDGYGVSAIYNLPFGLGLGLGYAAGENNNGDADQVIAGINYTNGGFYTGFTYTTGDLDDDNDFDGYEFAAKYKFENNFSIIGAYQNRQVENDDISDFFELTGAYDFNKHLNAYVAYKFNQLDDAYTDNNGKVQDAEDSVRLGLKYTF
ncbi:porin [Vibrio proteolyticus]|nr:porin [Vibrio proteolyticus]